jgi:hypothetical protein
LIFPAFTMIAESMFKHAKPVAMRVCLLGVFFIAGCADSEPAEIHEFLIRVGSRMITVGDYQKAFEIAKSAYPHNEMQSAATLQEVHLRLLSQLIEELVLLERAEELRIRVTDSELETAVSGIRKDFPEESFEQVLLEHAVSYPVWEKRLRDRLLMEKVVADELKDRISIGAEDILDYYDSRFRPAGDAGSKEDMDRIIVMRLRREKAEVVYREWMKTLKARFTIEINEKQLNGIAGG